MSNGINLEGFSNAGEQSGSNSIDGTATPLNSAPDAINIDGVPQMLDASNGYGNVLDSTNNLGVGGTLNVQSSQTGN